MVYNLWQQALAIAYGATEIFNTIIFVRLVRIIDILESLNLKAANLAHKYLDTSRGLLSPSHQQQFICLTINTNEVGGWMNISRFILKFSAYMVAATIGPLGWAGKSAGSTVKMTSFTQGLDW